jgi:RHS repeat-associated protein
MFDSRYKFTAKELDNETSYTYFGARYYDSDLSSWLSVDPLSDKYPSLSPYCYSANNPVVLLDPNGMLIGDFYDQNARYLGTDGIDDKKVYVVTDPTEIKQIKKTNRHDGTTSVNDIESAVELPSKTIRSQMVKVINMDNENNFREYGGVFGLDAKGKEKLIWAKPGPETDPSVQREASINVFDAANPDDKGDLISINGTFHSHASGEKTIYSYGSSTKFSFDQDPSGTDIENASKRTFINGNNYVFGAKNNVVYIYNGKGVIATFPIDKFDKVGE